MGYTTKDCVSAINKNHILRRRLIFVFLILAFIVTMCVFWRLKLKGIAMTDDVTCNIEEHVHTDECYEERLICGQEESTEPGGHVHTDACYEKVLVCGKQEHTHDIRCMSDKDADVETAQDWESTIPQFTDANDWAANMASVAKSQIGYTESEDNYELEGEELEKKGYTRYGAWYGQSYEDWDAMFVSFCLNYAGIPQEAIPYNDNCTNWVEALQKAEMYQSADSYVPAVGDLIFFTNTDQTKQAYRVGIITEISKDATDTITDIRVVEGDFGNMVTEKPYILDETINGYVSIDQAYKVFNNIDTEPVVEETIEENTDAVVTEENTTDTTADEAAETIEENTDQDAAEAETFTQSAYAGKFSVTATYTADAELPAEAVLKVEEISKKSDTFKEYCKANNAEYDWMLNVGFYVGDEEIEPAKPVDIKIVMPDLQEDENDVTVITHFAEKETEVFKEEEGTLQTEEMSKERRSAEFTMESFSLVAGQTYHTAKVVTQLQNGKKYLVYTVIGDQVYLMNHFGGYGVAGIKLSDFNGDGSNCTEADKTVYWKDEWLKSPNDGKLIDTADGIKWTAEQRGNEWDIQNCYKSYFDCQAGRWDTISWWPNVIKGWTHGNATTGSWSNFQLFGDGAGKVAGQWKNNQFWRLDFIANTDGAGYRWVTTHTDNPWSANPSVKIYFAEIQADYTKPGSSSGGSTGGSGSNDRTFPSAPITGQYTEKNMYFFNVEYIDGTLKGVPNVTYTIYDQSGKEVTSFTTSANRQVNDIEAMVGHALQSGQTYTMKQTATSDEFLLNTETWKFTVNGSTLELEQQSDKKTTGIIFNYRKSDIEYDKTAEVVDYANRTYKVDLSAKANQYKYDIDPKKIYMVVDQSNSMLFPSEMTPVTGAELKVKRDRYWDNWQKKWVYYFEETNKNTYSVDYDALENLRRNGTLQEGVLYYFIANETTSSTAYALWYDGQQWFYQDASYYAKAKWNPNGSDDTYINTDDHTRFPARNAGYTGNVVENNVTWGTNGGSLDQNGAHKIYRGIGDDSKLVSGNDSKYGGDISYQIYIAPGTYNRLHYLEDSMISLLQALAALNPNNEVTLETFTSSVNSCQTETLSKTGLNNLINSVGNITTVGGTRQDYALAHLNGNNPITVNGTSENYTQKGTANHTRTHLSDNKDENIVILITDGAPNAKSGEGTIPNTMSNSSDGNSTIVYKSAWDQAVDVRKKATLVTIGLGMGNVETGKKLLKGIATDGSSDQPDSDSGKGNWYIPEDSSKLNEILIENIMKKMIRKTPKDQTKGQVTDNISDTFVPIDPATNNPVTSGTWIDLQGNVVSESSSDAAGQVIKDDNGWRVDWKESVISSQITTSSTVNVDVQVGYWNLDEVYKTSYTCKQGSVLKLVVTSSNTPDIKVYPKTEDYWDAGRTSVNYTSKSGNTYTYNITIDQDNLVVSGRTRVNPGTSGISASSELISTGGGTVVESDGWHGTVYLKAKEDFIGGNTIDTNKSATLTIDNSAQLEYPKPNVNVRLLDMNQSNSFETVFLGDSVTPKDAVNALLNKIEFTKIVDKDNELTPYTDEDRTENHSTVGGSADYSGSAGKGTGWTTTSELKMQLTNLPKVDGSNAGVGLTETDLNDLIAGKDVKKIYTYSNVDGPVGVFTYKLTKASEDPEPANLANHVTVKVGDKVETYTLTVDYVPYHLDERGANVHNGNNSPGLEVDGANNDMKLKSENKHHVNVIDGTIKLKKVFKADAPGADKEFTIRLSKTENDYVDLKFKVTKDETTAKTESSDAHGTFADKTTIYQEISITTDKDRNYWIISGLPRGSYTASELITDTSEYVPSGIEVVTNETNCYYSVIGNNSVTFEMGYGNDSGSKKDVITEAPYNYKNIDLPNSTNKDKIKCGILGTAKITNVKSNKYKLEVEKVWEDGNENHTGAGHEIYVALWNGSSVVTDTAGNTLVAKLDSSNNWKAVFDIQADNPGDYSMREVLGVSANETAESKTKGIVVNSTDPKASVNEGDIIIHYSGLADEGQIITINKKDYRVTYGTIENPPAGSRTYTIKVTNANVYKLPVTGGLGTTWFTLGGILIMVISFCGILFQQKRKREGGGY